MKFTWVIVLLNVDIQLYYAVAMVKMNSAVAAMRSLYGSLLILIVAL